MNNDEDSFAFTMEVPESSNIPPVVLFVVLVLWVGISFWTFTPFY